MTSTATDRHKTEQIAAEAVLDGMYVIRTVATEIHSGVAGNRAIKIA